MRSLRTALIATLTASAVLVAGQGTVAALPFLHALAAMPVVDLPVVKTQAFLNTKRARPAQVVPVRPAPAPRRRGGGNNAAGAAVAAGVLGIIAGGIIASQSRPNTIGPRTYYEPGYDPRYDPRYDPNYYPPQAYPAYEAPVTYSPQQRSQAWYDYCSRKYRSFDPRSGTFLGRDGVRYFCQ